MPLTFRGHRPPPLDWVARSSPRATPRARPGNSSAPSDSILPTSPPPRPSLQSGIAEKNRPSCSMKLWLDADAAPRDVKEVCYRASERLALETILVANQRLTLPVGYRFLSAVRVEGGADVADQYIAEHAVKGDVAVTQDIPLAAILVPMGVIAIDPRGEEYTPEVIGERLSVRNFMDALRSTGVETGGHAPYGAREKQAFANALDRVLTRARRSA